MWHLTYFTFDWKKYLILLKTVHRLNTKIFIEFWTFSRISEFHFMNIAWKMTKLQKCVVHFFKHKENFTKYLTIFVIFPPPTYSIWVNNNV